MLIKLTGIVSESISQSAVSQPAIAADIIRSILNMEDEVDQDKEHFWVLGLTPQMTIKYIELVSLGIANCSLVHPREVFRTAISQAVTNIILVHNHPSGFRLPSNEDLAITNQLISAAKIIGIPIRDHVIVTKDSHYSFLEESSAIFK